MDWSSWGANVVAVLVPLVTIALVYLARQIVPSIPRLFLPILAVIFASAADYIGTLVAGQVFSPFVAALLGAAAVWIRELVNTFQQHKLSA